MRVCGHCQSVLRWDAQLKLTDLPQGGSALCCPDCAALARGEDLPALAVYSSGQRVPRHPQGDGSLPVCGLCRLALCEDDQPTALRVPVNDLGVEPGVYHACSDCVRQWQPAIGAHLRAQGLALGIPDRALGGSLLL
ncbi:MAG: hypothetical protein IT429_16985 [Gemmataceae bacterium]|nr:hypothetical protein [Gemmataceae bacterium]